MSIEREGINTEEDINAQEVLERMYGRHQVYVQKIKIGKRIGKVSFGIGHAFVSREQAERAYEPSMVDRLDVDEGQQVGVRSEERRVGKECRARGWTYD